MPRQKEYTARRADRHELYEKAVQNADHDAAFVKRLYRRIRGKPAASLKEDFCGTHAFCCEWVKLSPQHRAIGIDLDESVLEWGERNNQSQLTEEQRSRIRIEHRNVFDHRRPKVDIVSAFNFSYFTFRTRDELRRYFRNCLQSLNRDGMLVLDCFGGSECYLLQEERRECDGFDYVWDHADFSPLTGDILCKIHFEFPDGSRMRNAFVYEWRMWTLVEIRELLAEAGFRESQVFWEGTDSEGEGNGVFRRTEKGEACQTWICYIAALK